MQRTALAGLPFIRPKIDLQHLIRIFKTKFSHNDNYIFCWTIHLVDELVFKNDTLYFHLHKKKTNDSIPPQKLRVINARIVLISMIFNATRSSE